MYPNSQCSGVPVYAKTKPQIAQFDQDHLKIIRDGLTADNGRGLILRGNNQIIRYLSLDVDLIDIAYLTACAFIRSS